MYVCKIEYKPKNTITKRENYFKVCSSTYTYVDTIHRGHLDPQKNECLNQGDQIVRIFAHWAIVYFGQFLENYRGNTNFWSPIFYGKSYALILTKMGRAIFWAMFSQAQPVLKAKLPP
jgi:hypothetical protein